MDDVKWPPRMGFSRLVAEGLDADDTEDVKKLREEFRIPSIGNITGANDDKPCVYLTGHSLGLPTVHAEKYVADVMKTWSTLGVQGHFKPGRPKTQPWVSVDEVMAEAMAPIVGANTSEVAVMGTLTSNLHILMSSFYLPKTLGRHKIILEDRAFPSDHFAIETQIQHHGLDPKQSMVVIKAPDSDSFVIPVETILAAIDEHAETTAMLLLPGVQYLSGQLFDMARITSHARARGVFVLWDLAHAVGNVPLRLHDWGVDAAAWCSYKYLNGGPGGIAGIFVHDRHTRTPRRDAAAGTDDDDDYSAPEPSAERLPVRDRLGGWWGVDMAERFEMAVNAPFKTRMRHGAASFSLSNPSVLDCAALLASLDLFNAAAADTGLTADQGASTGRAMEVLRARSRRLTEFLWECLTTIADERASGAFRIVTPSDPEQRGAQLSMALVDGRRLKAVADGLADRGVVVDERLPNIIRVAPVPMYNTFADCYDFANAFAEELVNAGEHRGLG